MIELEDVSKTFPDGTRAVEDLSFTVDQGRLCVLLGPSGCGKTTTMKMVNRLISLSEGRIRVDRRDIMEFPEVELRRRIGYAIQEVGLFPHMTVGENIEVVPELLGWSRKKRRERAEQLLDMVQLPPEAFIDQYPRELSGGQRQRVGVARSLGADPEVLLMDEPFGAIDPITRVDLQNEFLRIQEEIRKTIVFVTHDIHEAIKMGDRIALMKEGRLIQYDTPLQLLFQPADRFVRDFVGRDRALKALQLIRVKEVMQASPETAGVSESASDALERLQEDRTRAVPVTDEAGVFAGFLDADRPREGRVEERVAGSDSKVRVDAVLDEALSVMLGGERKEVAVVDGKDRLQGLLSFSDIQDALASAGEREEDE